MITLTREQEEAIHTETMEGYGFPFYSKKTQTALENIGEETLRLELSCGYWRDIARRLVAHRLHLSRLPLPPKIKIGKFKVRVSAQNNNEVILRYKKTAFTVSRDCLEGHWTPVL